MGRFEYRQRAQEYLDELRMMASTNVSTTCALVTRGGERAGLAHLAVDLG
jgi:hypothetical protein